MAVHGAALALLPWMHTRFAVLAATLGGLILVRLARAPDPFSKAAAFLAVPAASAVGWLGFFLVVYGTLDPTAPYGGDVGSSFAYLPNGFGGLFFDQGFGLFAAAPVLAVALLGFARIRRLALEWLVVAVPYVLAVGTYPMWWAGSSGPARFLVPLLLPLAIPAAAAWAAADVPRRPGDPRFRAGRQRVAVRGDGGRRRRPARLPHPERGGHDRGAVPGVGEFRRRSAGRIPGVRAAAGWDAARGAAGRRAVGIPGDAAVGSVSTVAAYLVVRVGRRARSVESVIASAALTFGCAAMLATSIVWTMHASGRGDGAASRRWTRCGGWRRAARPSST